MRPRCLGIGVAGRPKHSNEYLCFARPAISRIVNGYCLTGIVKEELVAAFVSVAQGLLLRLLELLIVKAELRVLVTVGMGLLVLLPEKLQRQAG